MNRAGIDYGIVIPDNLRDSNIGDLDTVLSIIKNSERLLALGVMDVESQGSAWIKKL